jgi:Zn-dependent protease
MFNFDIFSMIAGIPGLIIAMVIHEYAHARVAVAMGDDTPRLMGRLTLNPIAHVDPIGLLMLFIMQFGWAKPVSINPNNFHNWKRGELYVSLAGPVSNLIMAFLALVFMVIYMKLGMPMSRGLRIVMYLIVLYNINFAIFNMIPIPPLDGSKVLMSFLPDEWNYKMASIERYSFFILIAIMMTPVLGYILVPLQRLIFSIFSQILSIFL